jgi:2-keto-4-pentenoate hydratase/2-oxohepta-3-ene-1,7-dioic acid hydratase in catechol pathway
MRLIRYTAAGRTACGIVEGERIAELRGDLFDPPERTGVEHRLSEVKVELPLLPRTFYAAGLNYTEHVIEMAAKRGETPNIPQKPDMGYRAVNALIAHDEPVIIPRDATKIQYEGEIVAVIGRKARHVTEADALSCVLGYTIGNDVSERNWQKADRTFWRSKNTDTFKPMGPWIETALDLDAAETVVRLNGAETLRFKTNHMLFGIARFISTMTQYLTLHPGDVIWMGTDGVSPDLKPGDVVEIDITGIGTLRNEFVLEGPA